MQKFVARKTDFCILNHCLTYAKKLLKSPILASPIFFQLGMSAITIKITICLRTIGLCTAQDA